MSQNSGWTVIDEALRRIREANKAARKQFGDKAELLPYGNLMVDIMEDVQVESELSDEGPTGLVFYSERPSREVPPPFGTETDLVIKL